MSQTWAELSSTRLQLLEHERAPPPPLAQPEHDPGYIAIASSPVQDHESRERSHAPKRPKRHRHSGESPSASRTREL